jgi:hypothetical protein
VVALQLPGPAGPAVHGTVTALRGDLARQPGSSPERNIIKVLVTFDYIELDDHSPA